MGSMNTLMGKNQRKSFVMISVMIAFVLLLTGQALFAAGNETQAALLSASKTVDRAQIAPTLMDTLQYTIVISNSGDTTTDAVTMTDTLESGVTFAGNLNAQTMNGSGVVGESANVITWTGSLESNGYVTITFQAAVTTSLPAGHVITNTAEITGSGTLLTPKATTEIVSPFTVFMPLVFKSPPILTLSVTRPNGANQWTASWSDGGDGVTGYELQESHDPNFGEFTVESPGDLGDVLSYAFAHAASNDSVYYYRVRALAGSVTGPWSTVKMVVGGYRDDFDDPSSGWAVRRMSYLEKTYAKYGTGAEDGQLIILVDDKWDWMIASPMVPAPEVPYVIVYDARIHHLANLTSSGLTFGGDWNGDACPEIGNVYQTDNCFNHFYAYNYIWHGPIKLLHERIDTLVWCPSCDQSPLKRIGVVQEAGEMINTSEDHLWHNYRVEVREDGARLYIDGAFKAHFPDTKYIHEPYFGFFGSTHEYKPSLWLYEYILVMPID